MWNGTTRSPGRSTRAAMIVVEVVLVLEVDVLLVEELDVLVVTLVLVLEVDVLLVEELDVLVVTLVLLDVEVVTEVDVLLVGGSGSGGRINSTGPPAYRIVSGSYG